MSLSFTVQQLIVVVVVAGAVGGLVNSFVNGFTAPFVQESDGKKVWQPGWIGDIVVGAVAALIFWLLYGPFASLGVVQPAVDAASPAGATSPTETLAGLAGSLLIGFGGGKFISSAVDKKLLKVATVEAAKKPADAAAATEVAQLSNSSAILSRVINMPGG